MALSLARSVSLGKEDAMLWCSQLSSYSHDIYISDEAKIVSTNFM
jgi:hypothetical protein